MRRNRLPLVLAIAISLGMLMSGGPASAAAGNLDPSFGVAGTVKTQTNPDIFSNALAVQPDGKIVVVGAGGGVSGFVLARYFADGSLDPSFGDDGIVRAPAPTSYLSAQDVAIQSDGRILVTGGTALGRFMPDGTLDTTFGHAGFVTLDFESRNVALQEDGLIVVGGTFHDATYSAAVARFMADGSPDPTFGSGGEVRTNGGTVKHPSGGAFGGGGLAFASRGRIVAGITAGYQPGVAMFTRRGALDRSFGDEGFAIYRSHNEIDATSVSLQSNGEIILALTIRPDKAALRFTKNGALDRSFGEGGIAHVGSGEFDAWGTLIQPDNKIVLLGGRWGGEQGSFEIARLMPNGTQDPSFGIGGVQRTDFGFVYQFALDGEILDPAGDILVTGGAFQPDFAGHEHGVIALAKYSGATVRPYLQPDLTIGWHPLASTGRGVYGAETTIEETPRLDLRRGRERILQLDLWNDGSSSDSFLLQGCRQIPHGFDVRYVAGATDVTASVKHGSYTTGPLPSGEAAHIAVAIDAEHARAGAEVNCLLEAASRNDPARTDAVLADIRVIP